MDIKNTKSYKTIDDCKKTELKLLFSTEISPIKVVSHRTNAKLSISSNCSVPVVEVCEEEVSDKENSTSSDYVNSELKLSLSTEISPIKVVIHLPDTISNLSVPVVEVCREDGSDKENKPVLPKFKAGSSESNKISKVKIVQSRYADTSKSKPKTVKVIPSKQRIDKNVKIELQRDTAKTVTNKPDDMPEGTQVELDARYCRYIQSLYLNCLSSAALQTQESAFSSRYENLNDTFVNANDKVNGLDAAINSLSLAKCQLNIIKEKARLIERLLESLDGCRLEEFVRQLTVCSQLIELDDGVNVGDITEGDMAVIDGFISDEIRRGDTDLVAAFRAMDEMLAEINSVVGAQVAAVAVFKRKCMDYVYSLLENMRQ